jgi:hypothetical protein
MRENPKHPAEFAKRFLKKIPNFDALNTGLSGLEIRNKKKTKKTSISSLKKIKQNCWLYLTCVT